MIMLQVRSSIGTENMLIVKHIILLRNSSRNVHIDDKPVHNTWFEWFWSENITNVKKILKEFERLEHLGMLSTTENLDV